MTIQTVSRCLLAMVAVVTFGAGISVVGQKMPRPKLKLESVTDGSGPDSAMKVYKISVENYAEYDDDLFLASPVLPPCGKNANASRTWLTIYNELDQRLLGFCMIKAHGELASLIFKIPANQNQPKEIFIDLVDRFEGRISRSKNVKVQ